MLSTNQKDKLDRLDIKDKVDLITKRAIEIKKSNRTLNDRAALKIASDEILRGITWKI